MDTCAEEAKKMQRRALQQRGYSLAAAGTGTQERCSGAWAAAWLQIGAGKRWIPAQERPKGCSGEQQRGPKRCSGGQQRGPKRCIGGRQCGCTLVPASEHGYLRGRTKRCSGGQQRGCTLVLASEHEYLRGGGKKMQQRAAVRAKRMQRRAAARLQIGAGERA
jgi:hypothetical protein